VPQSQLDSTITKPTASLSEQNGQHARSAGWRANLSQIRNSVAVKVRSNNEMCRSLRSILGTKRRRGRQQSSHRHERNPPHLNPLQRPD